MTIEIYQPGRDKPIVITCPNLFEAVDAATNNQVLLKALPDTKGFLSFQDTTKYEYEKDMDAGKNVDEEGTVYNSGNAIQLANGVIAIGS